MQLVHDEQVARLRQALDEDDKDKALMVLASAWQLSEQYMAKLLVPRKTLQVWHSRCRYLAARCSACYCCSLMLTLCRKPWIRRQVLQHLTQSCNTNWT